MDEKVRLRRIKGVGPDVKAAPHVPISSRKTIHWHPSYVPPAFFFSGSGCTRGHTHTTVVTRAIAVTMPDPYLAAPFYHYDNLPQPWLVSF